MNNETVNWKGKSSQMANLGTYFIGVVLVFFCLSLKGTWAPIGNMIIIGIVSKMFWIFLQTYTSNYILTNERIIRQEGIIFRKTFDIELRRVKDVLLTEPIWYRIFGLGNIQVLSTQVGAMEFYLKAVPVPIQIRETIRRIATDANTWYNPNQRTNSQILEMPY